MSNYPTETAQNLLQEKDMYEGMKQDAEWHIALGLDVEANEAARVVCVTRIAELDDMLAGLGKELSEC